MAERCPGFRFTGIHCGIKSGRALDLGLLVSDRPASAAAVFTTNRAAAAPVRLSRRTIARSGGRIRAAVVNSGNANAGTGRRGTAAAAHMVARAAAALGLSRSEVLVASTGVIGVPLPMPAIDAGIDTAAAHLSASHFDRFARAILTTDRGIKVASEHLSVGGRRITLLGCTKGAGMIAPNMATTLTFVATDASIEPERLDGALRAAVEPTYNSITIDGDTSTNDMILCLANGASGGRPLGARASAEFAHALTALLERLARALMRDGEGVNHVVEVVVRGARSERAARRIASTIANSPLVKTAIAGCDPNWGRVVAAAGRAGVPFALARASLSIAGVQVLASGEPVTDARWEQRAARAMKKPSYQLILDLGCGPCQSRYLACDLSHDYVRINADYRT